VFINNLFASISTLDWVLLIYSLPFNHKKS
jgi:hypothetical protein